MAINLNREGVALNAEERNKRNQNWTAIEQEVAGIGSNIAGLDAVSADTLSQINGLKEETATQKNGLTTVDKKINTVNSTLNEKITTSDTATNKRIDNVVIEAGDAAFDKVVDAAALEWKEPVATFANLATTYPNATEAFTAQTTSDGSVYRFNGSEWKKIQQVDAGPINEVDTRLTAQLAEATEKTMFTANTQVPLNIPTYDGSGQTTHPDVLYFDSALWGYKYWMAHTPYASTNDKLENPSISVSNDGVDWFDNPLIINPIDIPTTEQLSNGYHMSDTHLVYRADLNRLECWYRLNKNSAFEQILRKHTTNGRTWSEREVMVDLGATNVILSPAVIYEDGKYKMWYCEAGYRGAFYMESADQGKTWSTKVKVNITYDKSLHPDWVFFPWHIHLVKHEGKYHILLNVSNRNFPVVIDRLEMAYGVSTDPLNFNVKTIMQPTAAGGNTFDNKFIYRSSLVFVNGTYKIYYSGASNNNTWYIGLTEGETIDKLKGVVPTTATGTLLNRNGYKASKEGKFEVGGSYLSEKEVKLYQAGVAAGLLKIGLASNGEQSFLLRTENDLAKMSLELRKLFADIVESNSIDSKTFVRIKNTTPVSVILSQTGVAGAQLTVEAGGMISSKNESGGVYAPIKGRSFIFANNYTADDIQGAIRFNSQIMKHEGYDGTTWHPLY